MKITSNPHERLKNPLGFPVSGMEHGPSREPSEALRARSSPVGSTTPARPSKPSINSTVPTWGGLSPPSKVTCRGS